MSEARTERIQAAALAFIEVAILGYVLLRLLSMWQGDPSPKAVYGGAHIPYFWRGATAIWWAGVAAAAGWRFPGIRTLLSTLLLPVLAFSVAIAFLFP
jgi:hypothetical protein